MPKSFKNIYTHMGSYAPIARLQRTLARTPAHALHWYGLLALGVVITIANIALAWFAFSNARVEVSGLFERDVTAETINRDDLRDILEVYRARRTAFEQGAVETPDVIDPGE